MNLLSRFLQYTSFTTTSNENSDFCPSTNSQLDFAHYLADELKAIGMSRVTVDSNGYVYGMLPATPGFEQEPPIGFISHMDTAPDFSGENVHPQVIENYDGKDVLLKGSGETLKVAEFPELALMKGKTLITTDGKTLLGSDDKAGIAEIVTAMERLNKAQPRPLPHGEIWVGFTPDEEIGRGADRFDLSYFRAKYAYTVDGGEEGEISYENFNAATATFEIHGKSVHPGEAKGILKNAALIAAEIVSTLPKNETPATTENREGFYHLIHLEGGVSNAKLTYLIRDHDQLQFEKRQAYLKQLAEIFNSKFGGTPDQKTVSVEIKPSYANMAQVLKNHPSVLNRAMAAIRKAGLNPIEKPIRGGTDGAKLSFAGLPCPNLGTGGYAFHGPFEHVTKEGMEAVVQILLNIAAPFRESAIQTPTP